MTPLHPYCTYGRRDNLSLTHQLLRKLLTHLSYIYSGVNPDALLYDRSYGGVVTIDGMGNSQADYGSGWYSDHHFHYGYLVYAAGMTCLRT